MVGRNFIENKLSKNYHLIAPTKKELNLLDFEKVNSFISRNKIDLILHTAGKVGGIQANIREPLLFLQENAEMGKNMFCSEKTKN